MDKVRPFQDWREKEASIFDWKNCKSVALQENLLALIIIKM
ncbi:hypothetical protein [Carnobacterium viridans]|nr:hypothetical protein [Carnobacterium viridans]